MQIITAAVIKGGTGKSSTIAALAQAAAAAGKRFWQSTLTRRLVVHSLLAQTKTAPAVTSYYTEPTRRS